ncbi:MAG: ROK family protein [Verrucomicrobiales bacterium]|nr:ROK family protein [Verrucomicrobiales bacterium]
MPQARSWNPPRSLPEFGVDATFLALEIGGTKLQLFAGTADGTITRRWRHAVERESGADGIRRQIEAWLPEALRDHSPRALGVGFGGPVDWRTGRIAKSHQIEGWSGFALGPWLQERCGITVAVDNDANVAALGEAHRGQGRGAGTVFYVTLGSGVGGGLVIAGRIYHGALPGESEIGHVRLDKSGVLVEQRCSGWAVDRRVREAIALHPGSLLAQCVGSETAGEARFLLPALQGEDPLAQAIVSELADNLAFALSHVTHLVHPERIVLGGGLSLLGEPLRLAVAEALKPYLMEVFRPGPNLFLSGLREDAVPTGALLLARDAAG